MNVLIISANNLPMSPVGAAYIAGAALDAGHRVTVFDCLPEQGDETRFLACLAQFEPDVVGLSIPLVTCRIAENPLPNGFSFTDIRPMLKRLVALVRQHTNALVVAGGSGFSYFPEDWLFCLDIEYGLLGDSESGFLTLLEAGTGEKALRKVPGIIIRSGENLYTRPPREVRRLDDGAMPAYHLFDTAFYNRMGIPWGMVTKQGCALGCTWCSRSTALNRNYRVKPPERILAEIHHITNHTRSPALIFCDNSFNCPIPHVKTLCTTLMETRTEIRWRAGTFKPLGISREFCRLIRSAGCTFAGLSIGTASARLLANMNRGFRKQDIRSALENLAGSGIDHGISLVIGGPGETMASIRETMALVDGYPEIKAVWVNIGMFGLRRHLPVFKTETEEPGRNGLFQDAWYISPELDPGEMEDFIDDLAVRKNFFVQINKPWAGYTP